MEEKKTILIVEDDEIIADIEKIHLENYGYNVIIVNTGEEAVTEAIDNSVIDLILMDIDLGPGIDGTVAAEEILKNRDIPLIFLSSHSDLETVKKTEGITSYGYIVKTSGPTVLIASINMAFRLFEAKMQTKKKTAELNIFKTSLDNATDAIGMSTPDGSHYYQNKAFNELFGDIGVNPPDTLYVDKQKGYDVFRTIISGGNWSGIVQMYAKDKSIRDIFIRAYADKDDNDKVKNLIGIHTDITEYKKVEEKHEILAHICDVAPCSILVHDYAGNMLYANKRTFEMHGFEEYEFMKMNLTYIDAPESAKLIDNRIKQIEEHGEAYFEVRHLRKDGSTFPLAAYVKKINWHGHPALLSISTDITEISDNKKNKDILQNDIQMAQDIVTNLEIGLHIYHLENIDDDRTLRLVYANAVTEKLTGVKVKDILNKTLDEAFPGLRRLNIPQRYAEVVRNKKSISFEDINYGDDRVNEAVYSVKAFPLFNNHVGIAFDNISCRKQAEEKIKNLLAEKEVLLHETHHRIKNNMIIIKSLLTLESFNQNDLICKNILNDSANRIGNMMVIYDKLYLNESLKNVNIKEFLPALIDEVIGLFHNIKNVKTDINIENILMNHKTTTAIGMLVNELLTNSMKYAFPNNENGVITITVNKIEDEVTFIYADNGIGIPESVSIKERKTFGLQLIHIMVKQLAGTISSEIKNGTKYIIKFKLIERI